MKLTREKELNWKWNGNGNGMEMRWNGRNDHSRPPYISVSSFRFQFHFQFPFHFHFLLIHMPLSTSTLCTLIGREWGEAFNTRISSIRPPFLRTIKAGTLEVDNHDFPKEQQLRWPCSYYGKSVAPVLILNLSLVSQTLSIPQRQLLSVCGTRSNESDRCCGTERV